MKNLRYRITIIHTVVLVAFFLAGTAGAMNPASTLRQLKAVEDKNESSFFDAVSQWIIEVDAVLAHNSTETSTRQDDDDDDAEGNQLNDELCTVILRPLMLLPYLALLGYSSITGSDTGSLDLIKYVILVLFFPITGPFFLLGCQSFE